MICVILKASSDAIEFSQLLRSNNLAFSKKLARVFFVHCEESEFPFTSDQRIKSISVCSEIGVSPSATVNSVESNVVIKNHGSDYSSISDWGRSRVIRRRSPFLKHAPQALESLDITYRTTRTGLGVDVYMIDQGLDSSHPEFNGADITYIEGASSSNNHGAFCASSIVGVRGGIARDAKLFFRHTPLVQSSEETYAGYFDDVYQHYLSRANTNRPAVLSCSWGSSPVDDSNLPTALILAIFDDMYDAGIVVCMAAGNACTDLDEYYIAPVDAHPDTIIVGSMGAYDQPMYINATLGTSYGDPVTVYAPGVSRIGPAYSSATDYAALNGTSFATPITAGIIACMLEGYQRLTNVNQVRAVKQKLIENSTKDLLRVRNTYFPNGIVHNRIAYLDPNIEIEPIDGLVPI